MRLVYSSKKYLCAIEHDGAETIDYNKDELKDRLDLHELHN